MLQTHLYALCVLKYESEKKHAKLKIAMSMFSRQMNQELYIILILSIIFIVILILKRDRCGRDRMVVGFITTCAISVYHH
jgi:hypothetical protein